MSTQESVQLDLQVKSECSKKSSKPHLPGVFWIVVGLLLLCQVGACIAGVAPSVNGKVDLRPFYSSGVIVRSGHASQLYVYDFQRQVQNASVGPRDGALPFLYPPFAALLFVPLSFLSYRHAFFTLSLLNLGLLVATAQILRPMLPAVREYGRFLLPMLYGCLFGVSVALMQGQISFLFLLVLTITWVQLHTGRLFVAGLVLSLSLMKFQLALPIVLLFVLWRQWRVVYGFFIGAMCLGFASLIMVGPQGLLSYASALASVASQGRADAFAAKQRYGMFPTDMPNLHGLSYGVSHGAHWGQFLNIALCCLLFGYAMRQKPSLLIAVPTAMLVSYHMQPHDLTLLLLPLTFLGDDLLRSHHYRIVDPKADLQRIFQLRAIDILLLAAVSFLILPLAAVFMAGGLNYIVAIAVMGILLAVSKRATDFCI